MSSTRAENFCYTKISSFKQGTGIFLWASIESARPFLCVCVCVCVCFGQTHKINIVLHLSSVTCRVLDSRFPNGISLAPKELRCTVYR